jgi:hypothetical protein
MTSINQRRRTMLTTTVVGAGLNLIGCNRYDDPSANPNAGELAPMTPEQEIITKRFLAALA